VVEDVGVQVEVVEALRGEHHAHVVAAVEQRQRLDEEVLAGHLRMRAAPMLARQNLDLHCTAQDLQAHA
jgi:hypothetical protein